MNHPTQYSIKIKYSLWFMTATKPTFEYLKVIPYTKSLNVSRVLSLLDRI